MKVHVCRVVTDMTSSYYFVIVGHHDNPVFEMEFFPPNRANDPKVRKSLDVLYLLYMCSGVCSIHDVCNIQNRC